MTAWWLEKARAAVLGAPDGPWEYESAYDSYGGAVLGAVELTRAGTPRKDGRRSLLVVTREWEDDEDGATDELCRYVGRFDPPTITALLDVVDAAIRLDAALTDVGIPVDGPVVSPWLDTRSAIERVRLLALERDAAQYAAEAAAHRCVLCGHVLSDDELLEGTGIGDQTTACLPGRIHIVRNG